jgi:hypothetical protein
MISLTLADRRRRKIARWRMVGLDIEIIAEKPGRHRSTIFREFKRNTFVDKLIPDLNGNYCVTAHEMACERRAELRKLVRFSQVKSKTDRPSSNFPDFIDRCIFSTLIHDGKYTLMRVATCLIVRPKSNTPCPAPGQNAP